ncbi:MAG: hypothetical protein WC310_02285 [Patescibacteria group bacterium]|jgi:hypothetical protein
MNERQKLTIYRQAEKELIGFFRVFDDLCKRCFDKSLEMVKEGRFIDRDEMCCCLLDNQVQDHWNFIDRAQKAMNGPGWSKKLAEKNSNWLEVGKRRLPGNGPCPALRRSGCALNSFRVPTCSTQLCPKMLRILNNLGIVKGKTAAPRQFEEFGNLYSPLNYLFGLEKKEAAAEKIDKFFQLIRDMKDKCKDVPPEKWKAEIAKEIEFIDRS